MEKELIWVEKEFAEKYKVLESDANKNAERIKAFEEYMLKVETQSKQEFKANFDSLEEDVAIYTGLMLKVKQAFEKAKSEQLEASYTIWTKFEEELPNTKDKVNRIVETIKPLEQKLESINQLLGKIKTYDLDKVISAIEKLSGLYGDQKKMVEFLVKNFK